LTAKHPPARDPLLTLTHARVRAGQGDLRGARRVLREMLRLSPEHRPAKRLLEQLAGTGKGLRIERAGSDGSTTAHRIRRLEAWLSRVSGPSSI